MAVDWAKAEQYVRDHYDSIKSQFDGFLSEHPNFTGTCEKSFYPPAISITAYLPAPTKTRRKTFGVYKDGETMVRALMPNEEELNTIANFVGLVSTGFKPKRTSEHGDPHLFYELRPDYRQFEK